mgnify:CR=1 FL=1
MKVIVLKGKHVTRYYKASNSEEMEESARKIMSYHLDMGFYDDFWGNDVGLEDKVRKELENPSGKAWKFVQGRSRAGHEYEHVSLEEIE